MPKSGNSGLPSEYDPESASALEAEIERAWADYEYQAWADEQRDLTVHAKIEWEGVYNARPERTVTFPNVDTSIVARALGRDAKSWRTQLDALYTGGRHAEDAVMRSGLNPSRETVLRWYQGTQAPSAANQRAIESAYREMRSARVAEALSETIRRSEGAEVRFFDVRSMWLD
ncbi:hypothetical protein [Pseudonocardia dioxanivorans]|uniref:hypothetical protein n=1 Tax=Pseudonocardia dioxanivorans TaxID=240495 RepID=UPI00117EB75D|nr:hypothetical protein [Pseudonocardia dioxanivorans]